MNTRQDQKEKVLNDAFKAIEKHINEHIIPSFLFQYGL